MSYIALEKIGNCFLSLVIPNVNYVIFSTCYHVTRVTGDIKSSDGASVAVLNLSQENAFITKQAIEPNFAVFCDN